MEIKKNTLQKINSIKFTVMYLLHNYIYLLLYSLIRCILICVSPIMSRGTKETWELMSRGDGVIIYLEKYTTDKRLFFFKQKEERKGQIRKEIGPFSSLWEYSLAWVETRHSDWEECQITLIQHWEIQLYIDRSKKLIPELKTSTKYIQPMTLLIVWEIVSNI